MGETANDTTLAPSSWNTLFAIWYVEPLAQSITIFNPASDSSGINLLLQNYGHKIKIHALRSQVEQKKIRFFVDKKNVFLHEEIFNMPYFLQRIDYSIITFGMAAYEMLVMGIPATHICRNAEDIEASKWFQEKGYARSVCTSEINKVNLIDTSSKIGKRVSYKPEVIRVIEEHMKRNLN